jgi:hypothetical protein
MEMSMESNALDWRKKDLVNTAEVQPYTKHPSPVLAAAEEASLIEVFEICAVEVQ